MANSVVYTFKANDLFSKVAKGITRATNTLKRTLGGLGNVSKKVGSALKKVAKVGLGGFVALMTGVVFQGMKFQDAMASMSAITGATGKDFEFYSEAAIALAKKSKVAASEVAGVITGVASANAKLLDTPDLLLDVAEKVILLANAGGIELKAAMEVVTNSLSAFNAPAEDAGKYVNIIAAGSKLAASTIELTSQAIRGASVGAQVANLSFLDLNVAIQTVKKGALQGSEAGTALSSSFFKMESLSKKFRPSVVGLGTALENLAKKQKRMSSEAFVKFVGGEEAFKAIDIMIRNLDTFKELQKTMGGTKVASEQAAIMLGTMSAKLRAIGNLISIKLIRVFNKLMEDGTIDKLTEQFTKWLDTISAKDIDNFIEKIKTGLGMALQLGTALIEGAKSLGLINAEKTPVPLTAAAIPRGNLTARNAFLRQESKADVTIKLQAPKDSVASFTATAASPQLNVGLNMEEASQ